ncbi:MAG: hypothetical protein JST68_12415 [Bacteroidetes bacterium]|nr:hypothetical protein [Bacteroidota bacterium]
MFLLLESCNAGHKNGTGMVSEAEILDELDLAFNGIQSDHYPRGHSKDIRYNFFLDLEHGYFVTAGSRIHLYGDSTRWAIVFEKNGYANRGFRAEIELDYVGNCIDYPVDKYAEQSYITNASRITLIGSEEYERVENKLGSDMERFELIGAGVKEIKVRGVAVPFDSNYRDYEKLGIKVREHDNPRKLIGFEDFVRYLNETRPALISATEGDIRQHIPKNLPKLMTIGEFHFESAYDKGRPPSMQETYKLIAKVLVTRDTTKWRPTQKANNDWRNWKSGSL